MLYICSYNTNVVWVDQDTKHSNKLTEEKFLHTISDSHTIPASTIYMNSFEQHAYAQLKLLHTFIHFSLNLAL